MFPIKIAVWGISQQCPFGKNRGAGSWYTIYHHLPVVKGINKPLYSPTNQWEKDIYGILAYPLFSNRSMGLSYRTAARPWDWWWKPSLSCSSCFSSPDDSGDEWRFKLVNSLLITIKSLLSTINGDYLSSFQWVVNRTDKSNSSSLNLPLIHIKSDWIPTQKNHQPPW